MSFHIKNWKLALLTLTLFGVFISLGCWQLSRAVQKKQLLSSFKARMQQQPLNAKNLSNTNRDLRFYRATLQGHFDNNHTFLLDNKTLNGQVGFEIYTPFITQPPELVILVDRGFIRSDKKIRSKPSIAVAANPTQITGLINIAPAYFALGQLLESNKLTWPLVVEYIQLDQLSSILKKPLYPYVLQLESQHAAAFKTKWQIVIMPPEKHQAYAVQWFALALTLLVLFLALNRR